MSSFTLYFRARFNYHSLGQALNTFRVGWAIVREPVRFKLMIYIKHKKSQSNQIAKISLVVHFTKTFFIRQVGKTPRTKASLKILWNLELSCLLLYHIIQCPGIFLVQYLFLFPHCIICDVFILHITFNTLLVVPTSNLLVKPHII